MIADLFARRSERRDAVTVSTPGVITGGGTGPPGSESAQKLSAVYRAVDLISDDMSVLPAYVMDGSTRERREHDILRLLCDRPNEAMTPSVRKKLLWRSVLLTGNAYDWIIRDKRTRRPVELVPIPGNCVTPWLDELRRPWYDITIPQTWQVLRLPGDDVCHYKGPSLDGYVGMSVLGYAAETVAAGLAAQQHNRAFYESGGQPAGVLSVDADLGGYVKDADGQYTDVTKKDRVRQEWERIHMGPSNAYRVAVLDLGMKYEPITINHRDSQFIEQQGVTVEDVARFFGVPLYKLMAGKQSYNSNEQNAIEYVMGMQPRVTQQEEEQTHKLLTLSDRGRGLQIRYNMMALLRGDSRSRVDFYRGMREMGAFSPNDLRRLEDLPDIEGGEERMASLNYVPLSLWRELSIQRNGG